MVIRTENRREEALYPSVLSKYLPKSLEVALERRFSRGGRIEEIRLRGESQVIVTTDGGNVPIDYVMSRREVGEILASICNYSVYAYKDSISSGYVTIDGGIRVGVCGRAGTEGGRIFGVYDVSSLNIRIPHSFESFGGAISNLLKDGVLVYSAPGVGKTTLLRCVIQNIATGRDPLRVAVIDTRGEISTSELRRLPNVDILIGYPKGKGIEIASRSLNPQLMVCDEIGDAEEVEAIISAQNCGVPLLATAHGGDLRSVLRRSGINKLFKAGIFGSYVGIKRDRSECDYKYDITFSEGIIGRY